MTFENSEELREARHGIVDVGVYMIEFFVPGTILLTLNDGDTVTIKGDNLEVKVN